ncbi:DUF4269 domain-containing protein [Halalkalibacillus halophilus]|uniref:DUF4269 domain-containing protein n=1 Tax=Halalkalibacillus halophilus TaxID=392827 RepID=UPI0004058D9C|nr:DUF4269 domain-containing protein [Halalkalibacillus halophilus]
MWDSFHVLKTGDGQQRSAYEVLKESCLFKDLATYNPTLCGTYPLGIHINGSDLDIILEVDHFTIYEQKVKALYHMKKGFSIHSKVIRNRDVLKVNFIENGFDIELFAQNQPVEEQKAYVHMLIEKELLKRDPSIKEDIIQLKEQGYNTEAAFCRVLGLDGDPFEKLIEYGVREEII